MRCAECWYFWHEYDNNNRLIHGFCHRPENLKKIGDYISPKSVDGRRRACELAVRRPSAPTPVNKKV
jgi:hypothetical protein